MYMNINNLKKLIKTATSSTNDNISFHLHVSLHGINMNFSTNLSTILSRLAVVLLLDNCQN